MMEKEHKKKPLAVLHIKPIEGVLGTTIKPNEDVMVVRSGYGNNTYCDKGRYIGYIISEPSGRLRARVAVSKTHNEWFHKDGRQFDWRTEYNYRTWEEDKAQLVIRSVTKEHIITLNLNRIAAIK